MLTLFWRFYSSHHFDKKDTIPDKLGLTILVITDTHNSMRLAIERAENIDLSKVDLICFLGDITITDYLIFFNTFKEALNDIPMYGVLGNHDEKTVPVFEGSEHIKWLHGTYDTIHVNDREYLIGGLSGGVKYKNTDNFLITQKESVELLADMPDCDIFISHDKPCFEEPGHDNYDGLCTNAHMGLYGIGKYIKEHSPKIVLHGHLHQCESSRYGRTGIMSCYQIEMVNI